MHILYFSIAHILFCSFPLLIPAYKIFQSRMLIFYLMKYAYFYFYIAHIYFCLFPLLIPAYEIFQSRTLRFILAILNVFILFFIIAHIFFINFPRETSTQNIKHPKPKTKHPKQNTQNP